jgi:peptide/nickel transport system permease protein
MSVKWVVLWTDALLYLFVCGGLWLGFRSRHKLDVRLAWAHIFRQRLAVITLVVLSTFGLVAALDSVHFQRFISSRAGTVHYAPQLESLLDIILKDLHQRLEKTYSAPFARALYVKSSQVQADGRVQQVYLRLAYGGRHLLETANRGVDVGKKLGVSFALAALLWSLLTGLCVLIKARRSRKSYGQVWRLVCRDSAHFPYLTLQVSVFVTLWVLLSLLILGHYYHVFGTDKIGNDVLVMSLKSIRTGLLIGIITTMIMQPLAIVLGICSGYFRGWVDDVIQYVYTTLHSIPGVLLIAATILSLQVYTANHAQSFSQADRADLRLLVLCIILGLTNWTGLCRLLRAETLKLREMDYIKAARVAGSGAWVILFKHILPNLMPMFLIAAVMDFSHLVLAEAVLSYVGVGVDAASNSWGNMINSARLELAREPVVWWPLLAAFVFMFILVLAANVFADAVREGFDPRGRQIGR